MSHTVLFVDDEPSVVDALTRVLHKEPYTILTANTAEEAAKVLAGNNVDLIVSDEEMPGMSGTEFLAWVATQYPDVVRIVLTGHPSLPAVLCAINEGKVYHFFTKPCNEIELAIAIRHALEQKELMEKTRELLQVTKQQSSLIDRARLVRRLRAGPRSGGPSTVNETVPRSRRELLDETEKAIRESQQLLTEVEPPGETDPTGDM